MVRKKAVVEPPKPTPPTGPFAPEETAVASAKEAASQAKAALQEVKQRAEPPEPTKPAAAVKAPKAVAPKAVAIPPELQAELDQAEARLRECKAAQQQAERALQRRKVIVMAEMLEAESRRNDVAFHASRRETSDKLMELEPSREAAIAREARREARRERADAREEAAEMREAIDPDFEKDHEALLAKFDLGDLLHPELFITRCTPKAFFGPAPRTPGFAYPPPPVTLPHHIKLHRLAEFKGGEPVHIAAPRSYARSPSGGCWCSRTT